MSIKIPMTVDSLKLNDKFGASNNAYELNGIMLYTGAAVINLLKPTVYVMHQPVQHLNKLHSLPTLYLCVLYLSENKQRLVSLHTLIGFYNREEKCLLRGTDWAYK
jgi:hypothetical protein